MKKLNMLLVMCAVSVGAQAAQETRIQVGDDVWSYQPIRERMKSVATCSQSGGFPFVYRSASGMVLANEINISCRPEPNTNYDIYLTPQVNSLAEVMHKINMCSYHGGDVTIRSNIDGWFNPLIFSITCNGGD